MCNLVTHIVIEEIRHAASRIDFLGGDCMKKKYGPVPDGHVVKDYYISGELQSEQYPIFIDYDDEGKTFLEGKQTFYHKNGKVSGEKYYYNLKPEDIDYFNSYSNVFEG